MKYWLLTTEYPPLHGGGISTYCYFTAQMLSENGNSVTVFINDDGVNEYSVAQESNGVIVVRFNSNRRDLQKSLGYAARLSYAFADIVRILVSAKGKPDIIEAQDYLGIAYYLTQYKHLGYDFIAGVPIILTLHSPAFIYLEYNRASVDRFPDHWTGEMEKQSIVAADALISPTRFLVQELKKHIPFLSKEIEVLANPYKLTGSLPGRFTRNKIIYYGKLSPQKGSFKLLEYFKELWDTGFQYPLHIIGGTDIVYHPELQTMGQLIKKKYAVYIEKELLQLHGKIAPSQITGYLQDAHVIIVPSIVDNMPYVVIEAMGLGKIVLASQQGGQKEMIEDGITGYLFDHDNPSTFGEQLNKILSLSDTLINQIGNRASRYVREEYSFERIFSQKNGFLKRIKVNHVQKDYFPFLYQEATDVFPESKQEKLLLSVVIPYFNLGGYIEECIHSIRCSSYKNIEILVVNDGSTDETSIEKLHLFTNLENITVINRHHAGLAHTRNHGAEIARGEFLAFLDADDKVAPDYYEKCIRALQQNQNVFFAGSWVKYFEGSNSVWPTFTPQPPYALVHNPVNSSGLVYKKAAFLKAGLNDKNVDYGIEDYESVVHMLRQGFNGVVIPEILFYYRVRSGSMFRNVTRAKLIYSNRYITEKHKEYYTKFATQIINLLNANGPGYLFDSPTIETQVTTKANSESMLFVKLKNFIKRHDRLKKIALAFKKIKP